MTKTCKELLTPKILINSAIAGGLVLFGAFSGGTISLEGIVAAIGGMGVAFLTQLRTELQPKNKKGAFNGIFNWY